MPYPVRTQASDVTIANLFQQLTQANVPQGGMNRCMITVVTIKEIDGIAQAVFIATSGPAAVAGGVRTAINNMMGHGHYGGVQYNVVPFADNAIMINPFGAPNGVPNDYRRAGQRHCAEPKAIEAAAATGGNLSGMSTGWWGNIPNGFPDPANNAAGVFAVPCPICAANEDWIMRKAKEAQAIAKGAVRRSYDI